MQFGIRYAIGVGATVMVALTTAGPANAQSMDEEMQRLFNDGAAGSPCPITVVPGSPLATNDQSDATGATGICRNGIPGNVGGVSGTSSSGTSRITGVVEERASAYQGDEESEGLSSGASASSQAFGSFNLFSAVTVTDTDVGANSLGVGNSSQSYQLTVGADTRLTSRIALGAFFSASHTEGRFDQVTLNNALSDGTKLGGGFDDEGFNTGLYGLYNPWDNLFVDATLGYGYGIHAYAQDRSYFDDPNQVTANFSIGRVSADYDSHSLNGSLRVSYMVPFGRNYSLTPSLRGAASYRFIDGYTEDGNSGFELNYGHRRHRSITLSPGIEFASHFDTGLGRLGASLGIVNVFELTSNDKIRATLRDDAGQTRLGFFAEQKDKHYIELDVGASLDVTESFVVFGNYGTVLLYDDRSEHSGTLGLRLSF